MSMIRKLSTNDTLVHDDVNNKLYILPDYEDDLLPFDDALQIAAQLVSMGKGVCLGAEQMEKIWNATKHISPLS